MSQMQQVSVAEVRAAAVRKRKPMCRGTFELYFPSGGSFKSKSYRPQTLREFITTLENLAVSLEKKP